MLLLAIDTAGYDCAAAVLDMRTGHVISEVCETIGRGHAERLMEIIDAALDAASIELSALGRIAVTVGPGSFTGIRVGVAAARGLGLALAVPVVGVTTLEVMARAATAASGRGAIAVIDAKRGEVYLQAFDAAGNAASEPMLLTVAQAREFVDNNSEYEATGSGIAALAPQSTGQSVPDRFAVALVASIGARTQRAPKPLYLRGPDAKPQLGFAVARA